jgi:hypothetical protein
MPFIGVEEQVGGQVWTGVVGGEKPRKSGGEKRGSAEHGYKREDAGLTAMPQRIRRSAASGVYYAGLPPALDPAPGRQFSCPIFLAAPDFRGFWPLLTTGPAELHQHCNAPENNQV